MISSSMQRYSLRHITFALLLSLTCLSPAAAQWLVAHRGASHDAPENTLAAFRLAWEQNADAIEGDFYVTQDNQIVCIHDRSTKRTGGVDLEVATATYDQLAQLDVGSWKGPEFAGERIPLLRDVLGCVPPGKRILIEVKCGPEIVPLLKQELDRCALDRDQIKVIAFDHQVIAATKQQLPEIETFWLASYKNEQGVWTPSHESVLATLQEINADGLDSHANTDFVTESFAAAIRQAGMSLHFWTVNDPQVAAGLRRFGAASITTDRPRFLRDNMPRANLSELIDSHLTFDNSLIDAASPSREIRLLPNATSQPGTSTYIDGVIRQAFSSQEGEQSVAVTHQLPDSGTIATWYHVHAWYDYQTVFDNSADANAWEMWMDRSATLRFRMDPKGPVLSFRLHPTGDINEWHHLAVTWRRESPQQVSARLYVNGHLCDESAATQAKWYDPGETIIWGGGHAGNTRGNGAWDDAMIFRDALTPAEIRSIMYPSH